MHKISVNRYKTYRVFRWHASDYLWSRKNKYLEKYKIDVKSDSNEFSDVLAVPCPHLPDKEDFAHRDNGLDIPVNHRGISDYIATPIICDSSLDYAQFDPSVRDLLHYPQVKALLPNVAFRDNLPQQRKSCGGGYYGHVFSSNFFEGTGPSSRLEREPLPAHIMRKVKQVNRPPVKPFSDAVFKYIQRKSTKLKNRPIDLFFGGRADYGPRSPHGVDNFPSIHRNCLLDKWPKLPGNKFLLAYPHQNGENHGQPQGLKYPYEYVDALMSSKFVVSPWGWGAWCIRDLEALACGCVVVKPYCGNTLIYPDIYDPKNQFFVWTDLQFSHLSDQLDYCYRNLGEMQGKAHRGQTFMFNHLYPNAKVYERWTADLRLILEETLKTTYDLPEFIPSYRDNFSFVR